MGNEWTRLTQEAAALGGPDALRDFYRRKGQLSGAGVVVGLGAVAFGVKWLYRYAGDKRAISMIGVEAISREATPDQAEDVVHRAEGTNLSAVAPAAATYPEE